MIKSNLKPPLEISAKDKYASVQTIAYQSKDVNAVFCPVMAVLRDRLLAILKPKIMIMTGMSNADFEIEVNKRFDARILKDSRQIECDMSKYDKAQEQAVFEAEIELYRLLGMDDWLLDIWREAHVSSRIRDRQNGVSISVNYQRRSGDASTFFGNTLVLLMTMAACYDFDDVYAGFFAGDDSVMYFSGLRNYDLYDPSSRMADLFNLECKLLDRYTIPYFCSKFIISTDTHTYFVPDLLKVITKLGRRDMSNYEHVEEYRVSCADTLSLMLNEIIVDGLEQGITERYKGKITDAHQR
ncbi:uncharacterized protein LOC124303475 [Neodiprion virginianus]|uniref:uncharacterized protein LOC124303475 n=1 Tax=Neodiprion virginianus TaxID=2961670 RepID=UPI001EE73385|nr:uncharacterized protein LOC124303475 [Neodiprion virginianus]